MQGHLNARPQESMALIGWAPHLFNISEGSPLLVKKGNRSWNFFVSLIKLGGPNNIVLKSGSPVLNHLGTTALEEYVSFDANRFQNKSQVLVGRRPCKNMIFYQEFEVHFKILTPNPNNSG